MNILFSTICFINRSKPGAEIYATFSQRLIEDVMNKTPCDIMITTNETQHYQAQKEIYGDRLIIREELLLNHKLIVGRFNQLLKFYSIKDINEKYDWVIYLDCDAGITDFWDMPEVESNIQRWESQGYDMLGSRTDAILVNELRDHEEKLKTHLEEIEKGNTTHYNHGNLFSSKFIFYEVSSEKGPEEWFAAKLPSEHVLLIKNDEKLSKMCDILENFCFKFETQGEYPVTVDMEAFEIGVSALLAGYNMGDFTNYGHSHVIKVACNHNNWEKVKY